MKLLTTPGLTRAHLQFATGGRWEEALVFDAACPRQFEDWLAAADEDVALEAVFRDDDGALHGFAGFRRHLPAGPARLRFWRSVLAVTATTPPAPKATIDTWLALLDHADLFQLPPDTVDLGVFNQWQSAGSLMLLGPRLSRDLLVIGPTWLRKGAEAPICRESAWHLPEKIWIAEAVSRKKKDRYFLIEDLLPH